MHTNRAVALTALCFAFAGVGPAARSQNADDPQYAPSGDLVLPSGFETWVFVGSDLGLSYTPGAAAAASAPPPRAPRQQFHNVSINKAAYEYFLTNGRFPERTVLVMQVYEAADKPPSDVLASEPVTFGVHPVMLAVPQPRLGVADIDLPQDAGA